MNQKIEEIKNWFGTCDFSEYEDGITAIGFIQVLLDELAAKDAEIEWLKANIYELRDNITKMTLDANGLNADRDRYKARADAMERAIETMPSNCYVCKNQNCGHYLASYMSGCTLFEFDEQRFAEGGEQG